jgi:hypothetical protein
MFEGLAWVFAVVLVWALLFGCALWLARVAAGEHDREMAAHAVHAGSSKTPTAE